MVANNKQFLQFLQQGLGRHGYGVAVSGTDSEDMRAALRAFQRRNGLKVTGTATEATVSALRKAPVPMPKARPGGEAITAKPGGTPPADDVPVREGGFDRAAWQRARDAAATQASPQVRAAMGYPPGEQVGTFVNEPQRFDDFGPSLGPIPGDVRTEGYGMSRTGPGISREAFSDAFAPPDMPPDRAAQMAQALSVQTGNSPLAMGDMPQTTSPDIAQTDTPRLTPEQERALDEQIKQLLIQRLLSAQPVVPPAPPVRPQPVPSGTSI